MMKHWKISLLLLVLTGLLAVNAWATPTKLAVRAIAHDAKFIGSVVGGLKIDVRDFFTRKILASGQIMGGTGNTRIIMKEPVTRGKIRSEGKGTAKAEFTFDINKPLKLSIEIVGPMASEVNIHRESKTTWLIPGRNIGGDGIVFELYGLIVHPHNPEAHEFFDLGTTLPISAVVTPMCGCPVKAGSPLWNADKFHVTAYIYKGGKLLTSIPLRFTGKTSNFAGAYTPKEAGGFRVLFTAYDESNNQGVGFSGFVMKKHAAKK